MRIEKFLGASPLFNLYSAYDQILGDFQKKLRREDVHFLQALIMTGIFFEERSVRPSELAKILRTTRPNVSHALRNLEKRGLVERRSSREDARAYLFDLTREGKKKVPRLIKIFDSTEDKIEKALGGKEVNANLRHFVDAYKELASSAKKI
jgi:DNA-binding MarR family transcriptional regulator